MDTLPEWVGLALRWAHIVTAIAWIGASFFFNWLDSHLEPPKRAGGGIEGELWMIHSGGFYQVEKMQLAPEALPPVLHWFKWEAGFTWITGFLLLIVTYYMGSGALLLDSSVSDIGYPAAVAVSVATLALGWVVYDRLWRPPLADNAWAAAGLSFVLLLAVAWGLLQLISPLAAYLHVGALMGTIMTANVWMVIVPGQRELVAATKEGRRPDPAPALKAKQRSLHNNYMTLPVVFLMMANHFPQTWGGAQPLLMLAALTLIGAAVRHSFNLRNRGRPWPWSWAAGAAVAFVALIAATG